MLVIGYEQIYAGSHSSAADHDIILTPKYNGYICSGTGYTPGHQQSFSKLKYMESLGTYCICMQAYHRDG